MQRCLFILNTEDGSVQNRDEQVGRRMGTLVWDMWGFGCS